MRVEPGAAAPEARESLSLGPAPMSADSVPEARGPRDLAESDPRTCQETGRVRWGSTPDSFGEKDGVPVSSQLSLSSFSGQI